MALSSVKWLADNPMDHGVGSLTNLQLPNNSCTSSLTTRSSGLLGGGACAPSARGRLAWFVRPLARDGCTPFVARREEYADERRNSMACSSRDRSNSERVVGGCEPRSVD